MSSLETIRESISELVNSSNTFLVEALIDADRDLTAAERARDDLHSAWTNANHRADLHSRRCEIAIAILRDDEQGLTTDRLRRIADIIWMSEKAQSIIDRPTTLTDYMVHNTEPDFYVTPTWGEKEGYNLAAEAQTIIRMIADTAKKGGMDFGSLLQGMLDNWESRAKKFGSKFEQVT